MQLMVTADASGAAQSGALGLVTVIVDVIDFSTSMEAALEEGALEVLGASPDEAKPPVMINPFYIGALAGRRANLSGTGVVLLAEPRVGGDIERKGTISRALAGLQSTGARIDGVIPNVGAEIPKLISLKDKIILGVTGTGGVAFDAALNGGAPAVLTGTVARTLNKKGDIPAEIAAIRAFRSAKRLGTGIAVVAASRNSQEDILAAEYIYQKLKNLQIYFPTL